MSPMVASSINYLNRYSMSTANSDASDASIASMQLAKQRDSQEAVVVYKRKQQPRPRYNPHERQSLSDSSTVVADLIEKGC